MSSEISSALSMINSHSSIVLESQSFPASKLLSRPPRTAISAKDCFALLELLASTQKTPENLHEFSACNAHCGWKQAACTCHGCLERTSSIPGSFLILPDRRLRTPFVEGRVLFVIESTSNSQEFPERPYSPQISC